MVMERIIRKSTTVIAEAYPIFEGNAVKACW